jgi:uncharacterized membrane-anchored protein YitT (DUF2179 family)
MKKVVKHTFRIFILLFASVLFSSGVNLFLQPHKLLNGGVSGISMIIGHLTNHDAYIYYFALNVPILILGFFMLGGRFIAYSIISVIATTLSMKVIPILPVADDPLLSAVYAGVLLGAGVGLSLKVGGSTGGLEVLAAIVSHYRDVSVGLITTCVNVFIVLGFAFIQNDWNTGLYSAVCIYVTGRVANVIYTENEKVTMYIVSDKSAELVEALQKAHQRGVTLIPTEGAFTGAKRDMIMTVTTRYELSMLKELVQQVDPAAFVNVTETFEVMGNFVRLKAKSK